MVTRSQIFGGMALAAMLFVVIQCYLLYRTPPLHPIHVARQKSRVYTTVSQFVKDCDEASVHCILVDPWILKGLVEETFEQAHSPCRFMCKNHIYTFAVIDSHFEDFKMLVLPKLKADGFDIRVTYSNRFKSDIPTHVNLRNHDHHAIHVVILHEKADYYWYGPDPDDEYEREFTQQEGAIDKFDYEFKSNIDGIEMYMPHLPKRFVETYDHSRFIPCNQSRTDGFLKLYPQDKGKNATEFKELATKVVQIIKNRLDNFDVPFWLSSGTLLGWYRQCDFISYSQDVDVGVFIKDHSRDLLAQLKGSNLQLEHKFGKHEDSLQYAFNMGKIKLDIFFFYEDKDTGKIWNGGTDYETGDKFKYIFEKFDFCWTEFASMKVRVPCDTETYIRANYGPNWFQPVKHWDWKSSPSNVYPNGVWPFEEMSDVVQMWDKKGKRIDLDWEKEELR